jgi:hypothetical protein
LFIFDDELTVGVAVTAVVNAVLAPAILNPVVKLREPISVISTSAANGAMVTFDKDKRVRLLIL